MASTQNPEKPENLENDDYVPLSVSYGSIFPPKAITDGSGAEKRRAKGKEPSAKRLKGEAKSSLKIRTRSYILQYCDFMKVTKPKLPTETVDLLQRTPFRHYLEFTTIGHDRPIIEMLINSYDQKCDKFRIGDSYHTFDVAWVSEHTWLPQIGNRFEERKEKTQLWTNYIKKKPKSANPRTFLENEINNLLDLLLEEKDDELIDDLAKLLLIYQLTMIWMPPVGDSVPLSFFRYMRTYECINDVNWAEAVHRAIMDRVKKRQNTQKSYVSGCQVLLALWYFERSGLRYPQYVDPSKPPMLHWSYKGSIKNSVLNEKLRKGVARPKILGVDFIRYEKKQNKGRPGVMKPAIKETDDFERPRKKSKIEVVKKRIRKLEEEEKKAIEENLMIDCSQQPSAVGEEKKCIEEKGTMAVTIQEPGEKVENASVSEEAIHTELDTAEVRALPISEQANYYLNKYVLTMTTIYNLNEEAARKLLSAIVNTTNNAKHYGEEQEEEGDVEDSVDVAKHQNHNMQHEEEEVGAEDVFEDAKHHSANNRQEGEDVVEDCLEDAEHQNANTKLGEAHLVEDDVTSLILDIASQSCLDTLECQEEMLKVEKKAEDEKAEVSDEEELKLRKKTEKEKAEAGDEGLESVEMDDKELKDVKKAEGAKMGERINNDGEGEVNKDEAGDEGKKAEGAKMGERINNDGEGEANKDEAGDEGKKAEEEEKVLEEEKKAEEKKKSERINGVGEGESNKDKAGDEGNKYLQHLAAPPKAAPKATEELQVLEDSQKYEVEGAAAKDQAREEGNKSLHQLAAAADDLESKSAAADELACKSKLQTRRRNQPKWMNSPNFVSTAPKLKPKEAEARHPRYIYGGFVVKLEISQRKAQKGGKKAKGKTLPVVVPDSPEQPLREVTTLPAVSPILQRHTGYMALTAKQGENHRKAIPAVIRRDGSGFKPLIRLKGLDTLPENMREALLAFMDRDVNRKPIWSADSIYHTVTGVELLDLLTGEELSDLMIDAFVSRCQRRIREVEETTEKHAYVVGSLFSSMLINESQVAADGKMGKIAIESSSYNMFLDSPLAEGRSPIYIPICNTGHWHLLVLDLNDAEFRHYSSLKPSTENDAWVRAAKVVIQSIKRFGKLCLQRYCPGRVIEFKQCDCPQQKNGVDCGMYVYLYMLALIEGRDISTALDGMPLEHWRTYLAGQILVEGSEFDPFPNSQYNDSQLMHTPMGSLEFFVLPSEET